MGRLRRIRLTSWRLAAQLSCAWGNVMAQTQTNAEPSMEEILASIRRIISEEEHAVVNGASLDADDDRPNDLVVFEAMPARAPPEPEPARKPTPSLGAINGGEPIVSQPAASAASGALTRLTGALRLADQPGQTIEGVVRELLKPMLKEWLDQHLPRIVEAKVEAELERISRLVR
jgi:cell pole-organizing protein PopZ